MTKGIMVHYLPTKDSSTGVVIKYDNYKEKVESEHSDFKHIYFPSNIREGIEIVQYPVTDKKEIL